MNRYHIKIGFEPVYINKLKEYIKRYNSISWQYTSHCLDNLKYRVIDIKALLLYIKDLKLEYNNIFEFYADNGDIVKICFRVKYNQYNDLILVLNKNKTIITIYINSSDDLHYTLKKELYNIPLTK